MEEADGSFADDTLNSYHSAVLPPSSPSRLDDLASGTVEYDPPPVPPIPAKIPILEFNDKPEDIATGGDYQFSSGLHPRDGPFPAIAADPVSPSDEVQPAQDESQDTAQNQSNTETESQDTTVLETTQRDGTVSVETVERIVERDPYEDLDPFYKSSLARFVSMLRQEMAAETDEDKYRLFANCVVKETRLRKALYEVSDLFAPRPNPAADRHSGPVESRIARRERGQEDTKSKGYASEVSTEEAGLEIEDNGMRTGNSPAPSIRNQLSTSRLDVADDERKQDSDETKSTPPVCSSAALDEQQQPYTTPGAYTEVIPGKITETATAGCNPGHQSQPPAAERPMRTYLPFRYSPGIRRDHRQNNVDGSSSKAYSELRHEYNEGGRILAGSIAPPLLRPGIAALKPADSHEDETFLGTVRAKSVAYKKPPKASGTATSSDSNLAASRNAILSQAFIDLRSLLPEPLPNVTENPLADEIGAKLSLHRSSFDWIKEILKQWDRGMRKTRVELQQKRQERLAESGSHVSELLGDRDGYQDRMTVRLELKQIEAQKQLNEERREYEGYYAHVFKAVDARLTKEIKALRAMQRQISDYLASEGIAGSAKYTLSVLMGFMLTIFNRLESNYEERVRNNIDLERRRKQAERVFFVVLNDQQSLKKLDKDFSKAEQHAALNAARERNRRTNELMDTIDSMSCAGLGANQGLLDDILAKVSQILEQKEYLDTKYGSSANESALRDASAVVRYLGLDSENIVRYLSVAEANLNNSDYDLSTWQARVRGAGQGEFAQMVREKRDEDEKLGTTSKSRIADIQREYGNAIKVVKEAREALRNVMARSGRSHRSSFSMETLTESDQVSTSPRIAAMEDDTQERLRKALDEAKRRNAAKFSNG
ncbi:hypothetical protein KEM54_001291 [Ascosphaera aggregata]|nr:hypothetical protein KEM54_001291 [Ascosphaera aggregata]